MNDHLLEGIAGGETLLVVGLIDTTTVEKARSIHDTYPTVSAALGRAISGAVLLSSVMKEGQEIMEEAIGAEVKILEKKDVIYSCPCSKGRVLDAVAALGRKDIEEFINKDEPIEVICRFCKKDYAIPPDELIYLLKTASRA